MSLTFGDARKYLAQYAGKGGKNPKSEEVATFTREVLQYLLFAGSHGSLSKFCFHALNGCFTAPYELEVPLKIKIDGRVGEVWNRWYEWHSGSDLGNCVPCADALYEDPNRYPTIYDLPACGAQIGAVAICNEDEDTFIDISGTDPSGRQIFTNHRGEEIAGARLTLKKGKISTTSVTFGKITSIVKPKTKGYVQLVSVLNGQTKFLGDYSPIETRPMYRRFRITSACPSACKVTILAKTRIKPDYADEDLIPFENLYALQIGAQAVKANYDNNVDVAQAKNEMLGQLLTQENMYKRVQPGTPLATSPVTSTSRIGNIVGRRNRKLWRF